MAITLDRIINQPEVTHQGIVRFEVVVPHKSNNTIDKQKIALRYEVLTWDANGKVVGRASRTVPVSDWPASVRQEMQQIYFRIQVDAQNNGLIGAGSQEPME